MMRERHPCDQLICKPSIADTTMIHDRFTQLMLERCLNAPCRGATVTVQQSSAITRFFSRYLRVYLIELQTDP